MRFRDIGRLRTANRKLNFANSKILGFAVRGTGSEVGRRRPMKPRPALGNCSALSGRRERTDRNVISVRISERELLGLSVRIHVWLLFEPGD